MSDNTQESEQRKLEPGATLSVTIKQVVGADGNESTHVVGTHGDPLVNLLLLSAGQQLLLGKMVEEKRNAGRTVKPEQPRLWVPGSAFGN